MRLPVRPLLALALIAIAPRALTAEAHVPTDGEIRAKQALGRTIVAPDASFFVFEWMRPYGIARDTASLPEAATARPQTWLYRVDVDASPVRARYLFFPGLGDSYWLGGFSPDGRRLSVYGLDSGEKRLRAGVITFKGSQAPTLTWFDSTPDGARLGMPPTWISDEEFVYPAAVGGRRIANATSGDTRDCQDCDALLARAAASSRDKPAAEAKAVAGRRLLARSADGALTVYEMSDARRLALAFRKGAEADDTVVFENGRRPTSLLPDGLPEAREKPAKSPAH